MLVYQPSILNSLWDAREASESTPTELRNAGRVVDRPYNANGLDEKGPQLYAVVQQTNRKRQGPIEMTNRI